MIATDYLVIGSGIAGLTFAVKMAEKRKDSTLLVITKGNEEESNTKYAQGGVATVRDFAIDSFQKHIQDTLLAGDGLCNEAVVAMVVKEGPKRLDDLIQWGTKFDMDYSGKLNLGKEGGHSEHRIVHHKDLTGYEIETALLRRIHQLPNITILNHHFAIDIITEHQLGIAPAEEACCYGAYVLDQKSGKMHTVRAGTTLLATGGIGRVYGHTTNPEIATGDGIAMAYRAKAKIRDMEFVQFHPTVLYEAKQGQSFLISEAVRGFGAYLRNKAGHRFMLDYDERGELASRDIVSKSIDSELKKSGETCVFLDCTHLEMTAFKKHFPSIYKECTKRHIAVETQWIPVVPASHYLCGGIEVDVRGRTSIRHLFACGECACTGLHGANRLASNSLLEALVYAHNIYEYLSGTTEKMAEVHIPDWNDEGTYITKERILIKHNVRELQALMQDYVGIVRSNHRLAIALKKLDLIHKEVEALYKVSKLDASLCELRNMVNVAYLIIEQSQERKENRGGYYNVDNINTQKNRTINP